MHWQLLANDANLQLYGVMITSVDGYKLDVHRIGTHKFVFMRTTFLVITVKMVKICIHLLKL